MELQITNDFDVVIIGAGLAGLNVANKLLKHTPINVCMIAPQRSGRNNPARLTYLDTLEKYNLTESINGTYKSFGLYSYIGTNCIHYYDKPVFASLNYHNACTRIEEELAKHKNFTRVNDRLIDLEYKNYRINTLLVSGRKIQSKLLIDASGKNHVATRLLKKNNFNLYSHSFGQLFEKCKNLKTDEAFFIAPSLEYGSGGGWYYPYRGNRASVGFAMVTKSAQFPADLLRKNYQRAISEIPFLYNKLREARPERYEVGSIPIEAADELVFDRIIVVGDAAGQATPWMCMGVEPALENSDLAAKTAINALERNLFTKANLAEYQTQWEMKNGKIFNAVKDMKPVIWFLGEDVWDFIIEEDLASLSAQQFLERIRFNKHLMSRFETLLRWIRFRLRHFFEWKKYLRYPK